MEGDSFENDQDGLANGIGVVSQKRYEHDQDDAQSTELARVKEELIESNAHVVNLLSQLEASNQENARLKEQIDEANATAEENVELRQTIANLESELVRAKQSVEYGATQELQTQLTESKQEVGNLEEELAEANGRVDAAVDYVSELCEKLELSEEQVQQLKGENRRFNEILNALDPSTELRNDLVEDLNRQGSEKRRNGQYEESMEVYSKALAIEESGRNDVYWLGRLWTNISLSWHRMTNYKKALETAEKAIAYGTTYSLRFYSRGMAHKRLGNKAEAIKDLKKAMELNPDDQYAKASLDDLEAEQLP